jgi:hypothetical protein
MLSMAILSLADAMAYLGSARASRAPHAAADRWPVADHRSSGAATFAFVTARNFWRIDGGPRLKGHGKGFELAGVMSIQIIAVCACAGIIVGVISLTGVGARFSSVLLDLAGRQPASGAVLRDVHRDPARHGHAHHGGLCGGGLGRGAGPLCNWASRR